MHKVAKSITGTSSKVQDFKTYNEVINCPIHDNKWRGVVDEELWNLYINQTWCYIPLLSNQKTIGCKWVFHVKYNPDSSIERYKTRVIVQRFIQLNEIDYIIIFAPTIRHKVSKIFLTIAAMPVMMLIQMNIVAVYLESAHSHNEQSIDMKIYQKCLAGRIRLVCNILKSLYELKQAKKLWNKTITKFLRKIGFISTNADAYIITIRQNE